MHIDVVVVGAGPTGLMLAGELGRAGVRALVLERRAEPSTVAKSGGLAGQVLQLLHYRGELPRFRSASPMADAPEPPPRFPFGGIHLDFTGLEDSPMRALLLPQADLEALLTERASESGVDVRRGHEVVGLRQDADSVTVEVRGPQGSYEVATRYAVGCDGGRSRIRDLAGIGFPGTTLPQVERLASVTVPEGVSVLDDGSLEVAGVGTIPFGYTATERGVFACSGAGGTMGIYTAEVGSSDDDDANRDEAPMGVPELAASVKRVLGVDLPLGEPLRMTRFGYSAKQADTYREGRVFLAGDAAHLFPAGGVAVNAGMLDAANLAWKLAAAVGGWAPNGLLDTYVAERRVAAERTLLHTRAQVALRSAHGPNGDALRALLLELTADEQPLRRLGALMAGTDTRGTDRAGTNTRGTDRAGTDASATDTGVVHPDEPSLTGTLLTDSALGVEHHDPRFAGLLGSGRGVLLDLAGRPELHTLADPWRDRVDVVSTSVDDRPADMLLVRPDTTVAWVAAVGVRTESAAPALHQALERWFGDPTGRR